MVRTRPLWEGARWVQGGMRYTVNSTEDPTAPGGYYLSMTDLDSGAKATAVYDRNGYLLRFPDSAPKRVSGAVQVRSALMTVTIFNI